MMPVERHLIQRLNEKTERTEKIKQAMRALDAADALLDCGLLLEACAATGKAREMAREAGIV